MFELFTVYIGENAKVEIEFNKEVTDLYYSNMEEYFNKLNQEELYMAVFNAVKVLQNGDLVNE